MSPDPTRTLNPLSRWRRSVSSVTDRGEEPGGEESDESSGRGETGGDVRDGMVTDRRARRRLTAEVWIVLGLSLGQSGVYALVNLIAKLTRDTPLSEQTSSLNVSRSDRPWLDLLYQALSLGFAIIPVLLALYLLSSHGRSAVRRIGFDLAVPGRDLAFGVGLAAVIGIPGLGVYLLGHALVLNTAIAASALNDHWWTIPVLILAAVKNGVLEE